MALTNLQKTILDTIAYFEGTIGKSQNGYDILFGGVKVMNGWTPNTTEIRHRCVNPFGNLSKKDIEDAGYITCQDKTWVGTTSKGVKTTAAGRYQYLGWAWFDSTQRAKLPGIEVNAPMSKNNQDRIAFWAVEQRDVTESDLKNGLNSLSGFKALIKKLKLQWESFERSLDNDYHIKPSTGWEFYKGAYQIYESKGTSGTQSNVTSDNVTLYLDKDGNKISKFGTSTGSADNTKFYFNVPSGNSKKLIYIWPERETIRSRENQWNQIPESVKQKAYIIMDAGMNYNSNNNNIDTLNNVIKGWNSGFNFSGLKKYAFGVGGKVSLAVPYFASFELVALVDPYPTTFDETYFTYKANKIYMVDGNETYIDNKGAVIKKIGEKILSDGGFVKSTRDNNSYLVAGQGLKYWFDNYESTITTGQAPAANNSSGNNGNIGQPNANKIRRAMNQLNIKEKKYGTEYTKAQVKTYKSGGKSGTQKYVVPTKDPSTGEYKVLVNQKYTYGEMSNGGELTKEIAEVAVAVFNKIYSDTTIKVTVTGGNDIYHQAVSSTSRHIKGSGIDFTVSPRKTTDLNKIVNILKSFVKGDNRIKYIDEYRRQTTYGTGDHFHLSWGSSTGPADGVSQSLLSSINNDSSLPTYTA